MSDLTAMIVAITGLVAAVGTLALAVQKVWTKVNRQGKEFEEFYEGHLLRGKVEALKESLAVEWFDTSPDSTEPEDGFMPLALRARVDKLYEPIRPQLLALRKKYPDASEFEMARAIERRFSGWLARNICLPLKVMQWSCLTMAVSVADGIPPVPESKHD